MGKAEIKSSEELQKTDLKIKGFNLYETTNFSTCLPDYSRKDFFKICLHNGCSSIHYADKSFSVKGYTLFFATPHIPYSWDLESKEHCSFSCIFTEDFLNQQQRQKSLQASPFFKIGGTPVFILDEKANEFIKSIFLKMIEEQETAYQYKDELIRNYINLIIHEAHKLQPQENHFITTNAPARIASLFIELLERQFPITNIHQSLTIKNPQDFANSLNITISHLSRSVRQTTGKTTKYHINERIAAEAKVLLLHTDWNVAHIAYSLGFAYPTYFNNFFKKVTGVTPTFFRNTNIARKS